MRRTTLLMLVLALVVGLSGCCTISQEVKDEVHLSYLRQGKYISLMEEGKTTPEQDQRMLKANLKVFAALDLKINENEDAKEDAGKEDP